MVAWACLGLHTHVTAACTRPHAAVVQLAMAKSWGGHSVQVPHRSLLVFNPQLTGAYPSICCGPLVLLGTCCCC